MMMAVRMQWRVYATINYEIHLIHKKSSGDPYAVFTFIYTEAVTQMNFSRKVIYKYLVSSQENIYAKVCVQLY